MLQLYEEELKLVDQFHNKLKGWYINDKIGNVDYSLNSGMFVVLRGDLNRRITIKNGLG